MITAADIAFNLSFNRSGAVGLADPQPSPDASMGGFISTTEWAGGAKNDLFGDVAPNDNAAGFTDYRCVFIRNANATDPWLAVKVWIEQVADGSDVSIGIDPTGIVADTAGTQALTIANPITPPSGVIFSTPGPGTELTIGDLTARTCQAIWVRRHTHLALPMTGDGFTLRANGTVL